MKIQVTNLYNQKIPDSIYFRVHGLKHGDHYITNSKGETTIDGHIINGTYSGGFLAKTSSRWTYDLILDGEFREKHTILFDPPSYININKRSLNNYDFGIVPNTDILVKSSLSNISGSEDKIELKMHHNELDLWYERTLRFYSQDTVTRGLLYPAGLYTVSVNVINNNSIDSYNFDYEVHTDTINILELHY